MALSKLEGASETPLWEQLLNCLEVEDIPASTAATGLACCSENEGGVCQFHSMIESDLKRTIGQFKLILGEPLEEELQHEKGGNDCNCSLISTLTEAVLDEALRVLKDLSENQTSLFEKSDMCDCCVVTGVMLLRLFIRINFTGPELTSPSMKERLESIKNYCFNSKVVNFYQSSLEADGIETKANIQLPILLSLAKYFLDIAKQDAALWPILQIWTFRTDFIHQRILARRSASLKRKLIYSAYQYVKWMTPSYHSNVAMHNLNAAYLCEISEMLTYYYDKIMAEKVLDSAKDLLGLTVELTGAMGYRTRYQTTAKAQFVVKVKTSDVPDSENLSALFPNFAALLPISVSLNDDTRLERVRLVDSNDISAHSAIQQLAIIGMILNLRGVERTTDALIREELECLINAVIDNPVSWSARVVALLTRCNLENRDMRAMDRCIKQMEEVIRKAANAVEATECSSRMYLFFGSGHPLQCEMKLMFAEILQAGELWDKALLVYEELDAWEQRVMCYKAMNYREKGENIVLEKICELGETPKLLVLLGDLTSNPSLYEKAWLISNEKSIESQLKLGKYFFARKEYVKSIEYLERVVQLAPLEYPTWLQLAWAYYETKNFQGGYRAYLQAANMEHDNYLVWSNLGTCALKIGKKRHAMRAYDLATQCDYDNWKIWSNLLIVAAELEETTTALKAYHRALDLNSDFTEETILECMVDTAVKNAESNYPILKKMTELLGRVTCVASRKATTWLLHGRVLASYLNSTCENEVKLANYSKAMHSYNRALILMCQTSGWKSDMKMLRNVVRCILEFRMQRCRKPEEVSESSLKMQDEYLRQTAKSVFELVKSKHTEWPSNDEWKLLFDEMKEELSDPFHAQPS